MANINQIFVNILEKQNQKNQFLLKGFYLIFFLSRNFFFGSNFFFFGSKFILDQKIFFGQKFFFESKSLFNQKIKINPLSIKKNIHIIKKNLRPKKYLGSKQKIDQQNLDIEIFLLKFFRSKKWILQDKYLITSIVQLIN